MRSSISKTIVVGMAALAMAAAVILPTTPASAGWSGGSTWHGGGGWHGGGWGGGWHGGGWGNGWHGSGAWHPGYWRGGWYNGWWGPAIAAGVAAGALATYPYWGGYGYGYPNNGCWAYRPTFDGYGNYLGQNWVSIC